MGKVGCDIWEKWVTWDEISLLDRIPRLPPLSLLVAEEHLDEHIAVSVSAELGAVVGHRPEDHLRRVVHQRDHRGRVLGRHLKLDESLEQLLLVDDVGDEEEGLVGAEKVGGGHHGRRLTAHQGRLAVDPLDVRVAQVGVARDLTLRLLRRERWRWRGGGGE